MVEKQKGRGFLINSSLKPSSQCLKAAKRATKVLFALRCGFVQIDKKLFKRTYGAFVRSHLEYAVQAWRPWFKKEQLRGDLIQTFPIIGGRECALEFADFFEFAETDNLRGHPNKLQRKLAHMDVLRNAFSQRVVGAWNGLPDEVILGERDKFQNELARVLQQKEKLESLCRELQKQNHQIKEESMQMAESEDKQRKAVADRFQASILDIQKQLGEYLNKNKELREENQQLAEKLHNFIKDHEGREEHVKKLIKTRELEAKLAEAKLEQAKVQHQQEQMVSEQKIARLKEESELLNKRLDAHRNVEDKLKEQIDFYKTKYQQFNKTISNSNHMFETAKTEMEKMTKHVRAAEAQALDWRAKWEVSQQTLLETADALKHEQGKVASLTRQVDSLSSLCRALRGNQSRSSNATEQVTPAQPQTTAAKVVSDASAVSPAGDRTTVASDLAGS
ncbi:unnamed protein product [Schistocephalus solidus]|uniref:Cilia- and flagella-associated protein 157 n=1 Tax=Schistocephalus solidus TaxID=70667 RepID=A0A183T5I8_SCHSO|nr:unnamed protein product [Schistocephalus solidus]